MTYNIMLFKMLMNLFDHRKLKLQLEEFLTNQI